MKTLNNQIIVLAVFTFLALSCSKDDDSPETNSEPGQESSIPFQELYDQGVDRYLGLFSPTSTSSSGAGVTEYFFDIPNGPICFTGNDFSMFTRDGSTNNLLIFLQGGGFCSPNSCEAVETGIPFIPFGILNPNDIENPVHNYNTGYIPYCDGSAMIGDQEVDSDEDGVIDRYFRGIQNLSASLDVIAKKYPSPGKIVLAGNSAGGFAVHHALPLVRKLYPGVKIYVINDSGVGIINPGGWKMNLDYWNGLAFYPTSCNSCIGEDGNLTGYHQYQLAQDTNIVMAYISSKQDETFALLTQGGGSAFEAQLLEASNELNNANPERFNSLIANGNEHTFIISNYNYQVAQTTVKEWISSMLLDNGTWESKAD